MLWLLHMAKALLNVGLFGLSLWCCCLLVIQGLDWIASKLLKGDKE